MRMRCHTPPCVCLLALSLGSGCAELRSAAYTGQELYENTGRSYVVRTGAALGSLVGTAATAPIAVLLFPLYIFDAGEARTTDGWSMEPGPLEGGETPPVPGAAGAPLSPSGAEVAAQVEKGRDIVAPGPLTPIEYGAGIGAAIFGWPLDAIAGLFRDEPLEPDRESLVEERDPEPGVANPRDSFVASRAAEAPDALPDPSR